MTSTSAVRGSRVEKVRQGLLQDLVGGTLRVGTKLVNEESLAARFNVSRLTVREAVAALVTAGYLERLHGSGTYVVGLPGPRHALNVTLSYTHMIADAGMKPGMEVLSVTSGPAKSDEISALELEAGDNVRRLERLRTADDRAVIYSIDTLPERYVSRVTEKRFNRSLYDLLTKIGHQVVSANAVLLPVTASKRLASLLDVRVGSALQQIREVDYTKEGRPILLSTEWHVPGVFELSVNRRP
ncbi:MAG TPA: GntR family transcriptional regulator [Acidimicrobiales bacterium]|jgi:GntR family transcriptional regulator|nr:GntR family transcriptional regulator [Acidimicrobiales bacterium]